ncbi:MAG: mitochondrial fission ELM1 family protein [Alphaproteobacteria bacterium]|nr:mitochondrial fission ELM1 family protein [Alphaproteobacteria bacterium]
MTDKTIWVLADDRAGNTAQALGTAEIFGGRTEIKTVRYTKAVVLPNVLRGASALGVTAQTTAELKEPFPDIAIAAGRRAAPLLRYIKKKSGGKTKIVQIMFPGRFGLSDFDLIVLPNHDGCKLVRPNIMRVTGAPHRITPERLAVEKEKWAPVFDSLPSPKIALIIGGATKDKPFTPEMAADFAERSKALAKALGGGSFLVTTSRRTGAEQEKIIKDSLPEPKFFYGWGNKEIENPYFGFLALADYIVVTGDSVSMCSEACAASAPVYIYAPPGTVGKKHALLHQELYREGYAVELTENPEPVKQSEHKRLNAANAIADRMKKIIG